MKWIKKHFVTLFLVLVLVAGVGLLAYPSIANYWNTFHQTRAIMGYAERVAKMDKKDYKRILKSAKRYNKELVKTGILWKMTDAQKADYIKQLNVDNSGVMGYISIPKIHIKLPIYHGTDEAILQKSIGHLEGSSLPVGGKSSHCIITGHRGLPSSRLFTDLVMLKEGDSWTMTVLNETVTYEVDQIRVVLPTDLSELQIKEGKDYCTLVTCTPYGINTHRMLVRGHRIPNHNGDADVIADAIQIEPVYIAPFVAAPIILLLIIMLIFRTGRRKKMVSPFRIYMQNKGLKRVSRIGRR
jgi:sortase A